MRAPHARAEEYGIGLDVYVVAWRVYVARVFVVIGCSRARPVRRALSPPIVFVTSQSTEESRRRAAALGVDRILVKPWSKVELLAAVRELAPNA